MSIEYGLFNMRSGQTGKPCKTMQNPGVPSEIIKHYGTRAWAQQSNGGSGLDQSKYFGLET